MLPDEAIADCRKAHQTEGARWPAPLLAYLDEPPDAGRVFDWLCSCVGELLDHLGKATVELKDSLSMARRHAVEGADLETIEQRAWDLWSRRSAEGETLTAVAQLLFALSRADRYGRRFLAISCSTPIYLLGRVDKFQGF